ncbi:MAG: lipoyl synthase [Bacteroidetes bacterium HGW-Bacteroidetes-21]|nr:MAG: lipoyl synthase [Bacteroidetes bacterium HGW-Bacteroidetes-21]
MNSEENNPKKRTISPHKPRVRIGNNDNYRFVREVVNSHSLNTICQSGNCPNISECWGNRTATFMILGNICTRGCRFCSVETGKPFIHDESEPDRVSESVQLMRLKSCVITSVDRDDLPDGGATHWAKVIKTVRQNNPELQMEVLIPDFQLKSELLDQIIDASPEIISHNIETVRRLSPSVRPSASYERSLGVLEYLAGKGVRTKSGIMLGLGETWAEIEATLRDIYKTNCFILTIGQYLQPDTSCLHVEKYYSDEEFYQLKDIAYNIGYKMVESGKLIRSSYHAEKHHI